MTPGAFIAASIAICFVTYLLFGNKRFGSNFASLLWRSKWLILIPGLLFVGSEAVLGAATIKAAGPSVLNLLVTILEAVFFGAFQIFIMFFAMGRVQTEVFLPGDPGSELTWENWIGDPLVKLECQKLVASLANWPLYSVNNTKPANGALFLGKPGTGKSLMAKVIAAMSGVPVVIVSSASLNGPFMAMGRMLVQGLARKIRKLDRRYNGCIVFLDEIDAIGMGRGGLIGAGNPAMPGMGGGGGGGNGTIQTLLTEMSGADSGETRLLRVRKRWGLASENAKQVRRILWIAATNVEKKLLDEALVRSGRFGSVELYFTEPTEAAREQLFALNLKKKTVSTCVAVNIAHIRTLSRGMTGADVAEVCEAAGRTAVYEMSSGARQNAAITYVDLWKQIWVKKWGQPRPLDLHPDERYPIGVHEAGHGVAIVDYPLAGVECGGATLRPRADFLAAVMRELVDENRSMNDEEDCFRDLLISVNSRAAEEEILNNRFNGVTSDFKNAVGRAIYMIGVWGMGERVRSMLATGGTPSESIVREAEYLVDATLEFAKTYTRERADAVVALAKALDDRTDMTGVEVIELVRSFGKPKLPTIKETIKKIAARMKADDRKKRIVEMEEARGSFSSRRAADAKRTAGDTKATARKTAGKAVLATKGGGAAKPSSKKAAAKKATAKTADPSVTKTRRRTS